MNNTPDENPSDFGISLVKNNESSITRLSISGIEITRKRESVDKKENRQVIELGGKKRESVSKLAVHRDRILVMNRNKQFGPHRLPL